MAPSSGRRQAEADPITAVFESYGFIHVHIVIIMMKLIVLNDSIGGHIHIITAVCTLSHQMTLGVWAIEFGADQ
jgi:hypothetical protein